MICPNCGAEIEENDAFCYRCGYKVEKPVAEPTVEPLLPEENSNKNYCPNCGNTVEKEDAFCMRCGYRLQTPAANTPNLVVPVGDAGFVKQGQPEMICKMCGCKIPADSKYCPVCQQPTAPYAQYGAHVTPMYQQPLVRKKPFNVLALLGFIFGILGLLGTLTDGTGIILAIPGLVLSIIGLVKSKKTGAGKGFAIAGLVLSSVAIALFILMLLADFLAEVSYTVTDSEPIYPDQEVDPWGNGNLY